MLNNLFINVLIIVSIISISGNFYREKSIKRKSKLLTHTLFSVTGTIMAFGLMHYTINLPGTTILIDLRYFALIYVFYYVGFIPTLITGICIIFYRFSIFGIDQSSIIASITILFYIFIYNLIDKFLKKYTLKIILYYVTTIIIFTISLSIQMGTIEAFKIIRIYLPFSLLTYIIMIHLMNNMDTFNTLYQKYKEESSKDFLTGLYNTRQYDLLFNSITKNIVQNKEDLGYLIIDIDFFKKVNDTYGHNIGDKILSQLADVLIRNSKSTEIISRIGGEEFCILSLGSSLENTKKLAEGLRERVENHHFYISDEEYIHITISIGLAVYPNSTDNIQNLKELADAALYVSKKNGRNQVSYL